MGIIEKTEAGPCPRIIGLGKSVLLFTLLLYPTSLQFFILLVFRGRNAVLDKTNWVVGFTKYSIAWIHEVIHSPRRSPEEFGDRALMSRRTQEV